jgi:MFS family permease
MSSDSLHLDHDPQGRRGIALATWGLFAGLSLLMTSGGLFSTLLGVRSERAGLPTVVSSLIPAAYYVGFLAGSVLTLKALGRVGHIRVYTALASLLSAAIIGIGISVDATSWILMRLITGLCFAGLYVVAESWLNDLADNENRGRLLAVYGVITIAFYGIGQVSVSLFDPLTVTGFAVAAMITSLAVAPVALSEAAIAPPLETANPISLRELSKIVPTGVYSCFLVGVAHGAMSGMAAVYATRVNLSLVGLFVALPSLGGVVLQWPISSTSDEIDRRAVGVVASLCSATAAGLMLLDSPHKPMAFFLFMLVGGFSYPLYSISGAYTNDWIEPEHLSGAASQLVKMYGLGAIAGPILAGAAMSFIGPTGFPWALLVMHLAIAVFFFYRFLSWRAPLAKRPWSEVSLPARAFYVPATIVHVGRRVSRRRDD